MHSIAGFARAMTLAIPLARSSKARKLPGWIGPACRARSRSPESIVPLRR